MTPNHRHSSLMDFLFRPRRLGSIYPWYTTPGQQRALLQVIRTTLALRWNLADVLAAYAEEEGGIQRRRVQRLAKLIREGSSLADAVEQVPQTLSDSARLAIRVGTQSGSLLPLLAEVRDEPQAPWDTRRRIRQGAAYLLLVASLFLLVWSFQCVKIIPTLRQMEVDFDVPLFGFDRQVRVSEFLTSYGPILWLVVLAIIWYIASGRARRTLTSGFLAPLVGRTVRMRSAELLRLLSAVKEAGRPIPAAISTMARYHYDSAFRPRLLFVRNEMEQGAPVWSSMRKVGLLSPQESRLLDSAEPLGNTPWALRLIARRKESVTMRRQAVAMELMRVAVILALGAMVLFTALGTWAFLTDLTQSLV